MLCNQKITLPAIDPSPALSRSHVRFGSKADMCSAKGHVRFIPKAVEIADIAGPDGGQSISAPPCTSNVYLLRYGEGIAHIDAEISDSALNLGVTK